MLNIQINHLKNKLIKKIYLYYFIIGKEFVIYQEIEKIIFKFFKKNELFNKITITINTDTDWEKIYFEYQQQNLFIKKKIIIVTIKDKILNKYTISKIYQIIKYKNKNILLILKLTHCNSKKIIKYLISIFNNIEGIILSCDTLKKQDIETWIIKKIKNIDLNLTYQSIQLLAYYYQKNLLMLIKVLEVLKLISISNPNLTTKYIQKEIIENCIKFNIINLINTLLSNNRIQSIQILNYFKKTKYDVLHLIQQIQSYLIYFIKIKKEINIISLKYTSNIKNQIFKKLNYEINPIKIYKIINFLTNIEISIKTYNTRSIWLDLKTLITMF
ncbi:DNA polymerase III subunit delta [Buchnera aphidicola (Phyllaphis fagi)]|uniref:DNA polymerase III subunit delta n=1 Tax=Buchnera aphidicola TaxID=9 RepID=UPI0034640EDB